MKLLVIDDDPGMAALLARAMRKLGHEVAVSHSPGEAITKASEGPDVVIVDAGLAGMDAVELVAVLRGVAPRAAVAFLASADEVVQVSHVAPILPRVWTVVQVRELLNHFEKAKARGSQPKVASTVPARAPAPAPAPRADSPSVVEVAPSNAEGRLPARKVRVQCRSWEQVARLCQQHASGKTVLTLRGTYRFQEGEQCVVALALPDELVLALRAECSHVRRDKSGVEVYGITLHGLTDDIRVRLERMVANAATTQMPAPPAAGSAPRTHERAVSDASTWD
jgi:CheY-like chemotaxis protein